MTRVIQFAMLACTCVGLAASGPTTQPLVIYSNDFQKSEEGKVPADMQRVEGDFAVAAEGGGRFLRLAGDPIQTCRLLVGPEVSQDCALSARVRGSAAGRRTPEFGVGLANCVLWVVPAANQIELVRDDDTVAAAPFVWSSGSWTELRMQVRQVGETKWIIEAKAWASGKPEPREWQIVHALSEKPRPGRASLNGIPYSETPIDFDDVVVSAFAK
jgi:hypothetical protein